ncbi:MAG: class I SAM-dependent methyltransferase [Candidatus Nealsonbacteria bacterium]|nr:class I SAM-dependent methyltransferase [Candidatus Nealsonbacteria bacterium]
MSNKNLEPENRKVLLDMGCGEGNDSLFFANKGYYVIGVEKDKKVFEKAKESVLLEKKEKFIKLYNEDIREIDLKGKFDAVLFHFVLMFMSKKDALGLIEKYFNKLNKGGEMLIKVLMSDDKIAESHKGGKYFYPKIKELEEVRDKYQAVFLEFRKKKDNPHGKNKHPHIHSIGILKIIKK